MQRRSTVSFIVLGFTNNESANILLGDGTILWKPRFGMMV
jgi:hypothetical protein